MNIDPRGMDVMNWTAQMTPMLQRFGPVPRLLHPDSWMQWAIRVLELLSHSGFIVPDPRTFSDWTTWAIRFNQTVTLPG